MSVPTLVPDVVIEFQDEEPLEVHSAILRLASPVFDSMLAGDMLEGQSKRVSAKDFKRADFEAFYRFLGPLALCEKGLTDESVAQVLPLAEYYQVGALKMLCAQHLEKGPATVELLILAKRFALDELYTRGIKRYSRKM